MIARDASGNGIGHKSVVTETVDETIAKMRNFIAEANTISLAVHDMMSEDSAQWRAELAAEMAG
jgi:hypothetical protein